MGASFVKALSFSPLVVHYMDSLIVDNLYYEREGQLWHPFISRMYFGALAYIQTLRAMQYAKLGSLATRQLTTQVLADIQPEKLPIPGPLMPMLKSLCVSKPDDDTFNLVCPLIPENPGHQPDHIEPAHDYMLCMPNLPLIGCKPPIT
ncbi:unnamed protein product [Macrosiphum euphorbiae]|uniref:Anaphase-promoting complex subunit 1 n=1 Tax=Macrosiphum euphorbiae TaxID=13131 RepID=A0AAV0WNG1_9HEMI|nr:unnamed protein product [Macrosiphum euphorbiae]